MLQIKKFDINSIVFFLLVWCFFSLNSRYFQIPYALIVRWVIFGVLILLSAARQSSYRQLPKLIPAFLVAAIPSLFSSIDLSESVIKMLSFLVVVYGGYLYFTSFETAEQFEAALKTIMVVAICFEIQSIFAIILGFGYGSGDDRATGITTNPNTLGIYSNLSLLASYYWYKKKTGLIKFFFAALMIGSVWTQILCGSRAGIAIMAIVFIIVYLINNRGGFRPIIAVAAIAIAAVFVLSGGLSVFNIRGLNALLQEGGTSRGELWQYGLNIWKQYPIFGCGYSTSNLHNLREFEYHYDFHNSYITILAEVGLWGVLIFGTVFVASLVKIGLMAKNSMQNKKSVSLPFICLIYYVILLVAAYSESFLFAVGSTEACIFWLLFSWGIAYIDYYTSNQYFQ